jgi:hypothetical protein
MRTSAVVMAIAAVVALTAPARDALAQGKGVIQGDTPSAGPTDRRGAAAGGGVGRGSTPAEPDTPPVARDVPAEAPERWNSAAAAIWHVRGRVRVAIGYSGIRSSAEEAKSNALAACKSAGGSGCNAIGAWNAGCLYITTGHTANRAGWASGASSGAATKKCRSNGFTCKPPIGGCID